jgi:hypothetical protein
MSNGQCVEAKLIADGHVGVRDSKAPEGPNLCFAPAVWRAFLADIRGA